MPEASHRHGKYLIKAALGEAAEQIDNNRVTEQHCNSVMMVSPEQHLVRRLDSVNTSQRVGMTAQQRKLQQCHDHVAR
jgi:hypothetical protein